MSYELFIGDRTFSSWSLRGWLMLEKFDLPFQTSTLSLYDGSFRSALEPLAPARLVPVLRCADGTVIGETLAIAEELNERHPEAQMWPADPAARAFARWISAEMHAGFMALRNECPMQLIHQYQHFPVSDAVAADLARIEDLWTRARQQFGADGPVALWALLTGGCVLRAGCGPDRRPRLTGRPDRCGLCGNHAGRSQLPPLALPGPDPQL